MGLHNRRGIGAILTQNSTFIHLVLTISIWYSQHNIFQPLGSLFTVQHLTFDCNWKYSLFFSCQGMEETSVQSPQAQHLISSEFVHSTPLILASPSVQQACYKTFKQLAVSPIKCSKHFFFCFKTSKLTKEKRKQRILSLPNRNIWLITLGLKRVSCNWGRSEGSSSLDQNWRFFVKPIFEMGISFFSLT